MSQAAPCTQSHRRLARGAQTAALQRPPLLLLLPLQLTPRSHSFIFLLPIRSRQQAPPDRCSLRHSCKRRSLQSIQCKLLKVQCIQMPLAKMQHIEAHRVVLVSQQ